MSLSRMAKTKQNKQTNKQNKTTTTNKQKNNNTKTKQNITTNRSRVSASSLSTYYSCFNIWLNSLHWLNWRNDMGEESVINLILHFTPTYYVHNVIQKWRQSLVASLQQTNKLILFHVKGLVLRGRNGTEKNTLLLLLLVWPGGRGV